MSDEVRRKMKRYKVSVVVPNYNYAKYLRRRVRSIFKQSYPIHELIILDDASTDGSPKVICEIKKWAREKYPEVSVKTILNEKNTGQPIRQWIRGIEAASGDFIWIAEADDGANRKFLEEVMKGFSDPKVVMSYAESRAVNSIGLTILPNYKYSRDKEKTGHYNQSYIREGADEIREIMAIRCTVPNVSGVVFRRTPEMLKYLEEALKFEQVGDWYFYTKLLENGKISYNRKPLNYFRIHGGSATKRGKGHLEEVKVMHEYFKRHYELSPVTLDRMAREVERIRVKYGIIEE